MKENNSNDEFDKFKNTKEFQIVIKGLENSIKQYGCAEKKQKDSLLNGILGTICRFAEMSFYASQKLKLLKIVEEKEINNNDCLIDSVKTDNPKFDKAFNEDRLLQKIEESGEKMCIGEFAKYWFEKGQKR
jgi:hypothetical protein